MRAAYSVWPELEQVLGAATGFDAVGHLRLYERPHDVGEAETRARVQSDMGIPTTHLDRAALLELEPGLSPDVLGALHCPLDGVADHTATTRAYAAAARAEGATIVERTAVADVSLDGGRARSVSLEDGSTVEVGRGLLLLANAGVSPLVQRAWGVTLPVWTVLPQALLTEPVSVLPFASLIGHAHRPLSLKMAPDRRVMITGGWRGRWNPDSGVPEMIPGSVAGNVAQAVEVFPALEGLRVAQAVADRPETICLDGVPIIDHLPGAENVLVAVGWTGHGWAIAPAVAPLLAEWATAGEAPPLLRPFALDRFPGF
jgi:sarcosine oxidase subunit beta